MEFLLLILPALALAGLAWRWRTQRASGVRVKPQARGVESLDTLVAWTPEPTAIMNPAERQAYSVLRRALPEHLVLAQVPLARFIKVPTRHSYGEWLRRAGQLCADLVVCDGNSQVVAVVEIRRTQAGLSDKSARRHARMQRVLKAAGIPLHVWPEGHLPGPSAVRSTLITSEAGQRATAQAAVRRAGPMPVEPPPSTWYADLESAPAPLMPTEGTRA